MARFVSLFLLAAAIFCWAPGSTPGETLPSLRERLLNDSGATSPAPPPNFQRHIVPLLGRLGCNGRSCHGSFQGRGGFRLSMFGYNFAEDHQALLTGDLPRVNPSSPDESLLLVKPISDDEHEGESASSLAAGRTERFGHGSPPAPKTTAIRRAGCSAWR